MAAGWSVISAQTRFRVCREEDRCRFSEEIMLESNGWGGTTFRRKAIPRWKRVLESNVLESNVLESNRGWGLFACSGRVW